MRDKILNGAQSIAVVGLGYVGLPLAVAFAQKGVRVIGFDVSETKINAYKNGIDVTQEVGSDTLLSTPNITFTCDPKALSGAHFIIVCVPTPVLANNNPDLSLIEKASKLIGENMPRGAVVVYESTVYPGV
ncbi:MAG: 2-dehydropantoate 2-reductase N-terminal domain-containing protein, partial [Alphaproteobacteria bacterium]|nr:2-dehydropantoate 2-reductase N-terminal domain-containing protein [Alphaproteobacteria bacterium]